jgi:pyrroline-5-carboxylate reductase
MNNILIVGCGHMGSSLLKAWFNKTNLSFSVIDPLKYKNINKIFNQRVKAYKSESDIEDILCFDLIIFSVKPQISEKVLIKFKDYKFKEKTIFISIIAGKKISFFNKYISKNNKFIRAMPNMPVLINMGMTCLLANKKVSLKDKKNVNFLFDKVGKTLWLNNELEINKVTAISGSGPGYIFLIIDAFEKAALELGLNKQSTKELVHQTFLGSVNLLFHEKQTAEILSKNIAVKGGTTEAGLNEFNKNKKLHKMFIKVVKAAYFRANILGK